MKHPRLSAFLAAILPITPLLLSITVVSPAAVADEATGGLAPVIVTATRTAEIADETLAPVIVITREDIARSQATDVADLLRFHAGLEIARNGGPGQAASLFMRGTDSNHTLVLVDGVKINPGTIGGAALQNINPAIIERIEIVKGPRSTLYGSEAIGGVINIITRSPQAGTRAELAYGVGKYETRTATLDLRHREGDRRSGITVSGLESDGFPTRDTSDIDRGHDNTTINAYLGTAFGPVDAEVSLWRAAGNTEYLDFFLTPLDQDYENRVTALTLKAAPGAAWSSLLRLSHTIDEIDQNQGSDYAHTRRGLLDWQNDIQLGERHLLSTGLWLSREDTAARSFGTSFEEETSVKAVYLQDDMDLGAHRVLLAARLTDHDSFGSYFTWDVEYGYRLNTSTRFTAAAGTAFRAPDSTDRFGFGGNPDLDPETARNLEVGVRHALGRHHRLSANAFRNDIEDLIEYDFGSASMRNIGKARITGLELGYDFEQGPWQLRTALSLQDPENRDTGDRLLRRASRSLSASLRYEQPRYALNVDLLATGERKDFGGDLDGYELVNASLLLRPLPYWEARFKIENLLDQAYQLARGYNTSERALFLELRYRYAGRPDSV